MSSRLLDFVLLVVIWCALGLILLSVGGCSLFRSSRIEARADYNVVAEDCSVSIVAVGYCGE